MGRSSCPWKAPRSCPRKCAMCERLKVIGAEKLVGTVLMRQEKGTIARQVKPLLQLRFARITPC